MSISAIGHIGICVSDMERSLHFWRDGLGFEIVGGGNRFRNAWSKILELDGLDMHNWIMRRDHVTLELMCFDKPGHVGTSEPRPWNQLGFTHIAVWCSDIDAVEKLIVEYGGTVLESSRTVFTHPNLHGKWLICTDPDGVRVELVQYPEGEKNLVER